MDVQAATLTGHCERNYLSCRTLRISIEDCAQILTACLEEKVMKTSIPCSGKGLCSPFGCQCFLGYHGDYCGECAKGYTSFEERCLKVARVSLLTVTSNIYSDKSDINTIDRRVPAEPYISNKLPLRVSSVGRKDLKDSQDYRLLGSLDQAPNQPWRKHTVHDISKYFPVICFLPKASC